MIEQITLTINKDTARILARFIAMNGYEWRQLYDDQNQIRHSYSATVPSSESREAWKELIGALEEKQTPSIPITY